nr:hypothetical protein [Salmonella enterica subsp. diarizonae]
MCDRDTPILLLNIFVEVDKNGGILDSCFKDILSNDRYVAIIFGQHVHIVDILSKQVSSLHLCDFIGHIYAVPNSTENKLSENFLVTTYSYVFLINVAKGILWKSNMCGIDGVIITDINDGVISGSGEWDPPGGWVNFWLLLSNGASIKIGEDR